MNLIKLLAFIIYLVSCTKEPTPDIDLGGHLESSSWHTNCLTTSAGRAKSTAQILGGNYSVSYFFYSDANCTNLASDIEESGTYSASAMDSNGNGDIDFTVSVLSVTPKTSAQAATYNSSTYCGFNDWAANVTKSIFSRTCDSVAMPASGATQYSIYYIAPITDPINGGNLFLGVSTFGHDGTTALQRHVSLGSVVYENSL
jgi:hypothetical protein